LDRIWRFLSSDLLLLIGLRCFDLHRVDHCRWLSAKGLVRAAVIVELNVRTPTLTTGARFFIAGTLGLAERFMSMR